MVNFTSGSGGGGVAHPTRAPLKVIEHRSQKASECTI